MAMSWLSKLRTKAAPSSLNNDVCSVCQNLSPTSEDDAKFGVTVSVSLLLSPKVSADCPYCELIKQVLIHYERSLVRTLIFEGVPGKPIVMTFGDRTDHFQIWYLLYKLNGT